MSDGVNFLEFPEWEEMVFWKNCLDWGEWYATYLSPRPWNDTWYLDGDVRAIFDLFASSVPDGWHKPENWSEGTYHGRVLDWYGFNY